MDNTVLLHHILPREFVIHFDLVEVLEIEGRLIFKLDEKYVTPPEHEDKPLESKGFTPALSLYDFPIRDKGVTLKIRCRKWKDKQTGKVYSRDWNFKAKGTSYTKDFGTFLKALPRY